MEQDYLYKHLLDMAKASANRREDRFSRFLNPSQMALALKAAHMAGTCVLFSGGYQGAEYQMACFTHAQDVLWPIECLGVKWNEKYGAANHRDLLGAVMALGIERELIGDIALNDGGALIFAAVEVGDYICSSLEKAGRVSLKITKCGGDLVIPPPKGRAVRETVNSLRLDALIASAYKLSREKARQITERGDVRLNHIQTEQAASKVSQGDLISVRGEGRFKIASVLGETRRGRIAVELFKYGT